jgi:hypothetical protein
MRNFETITTGEFIMKARIIQWLAILLVLETGLLHLMTAQGEYEEVAYMGYLFVGNFLLALIAAYGIYRQQLWGWLAGLFLAAGSIAGYIWSRTLGMPGMEVEEWLTPFGISALIVEGLFVLLFILRPWRFAETEQLTSYMGKSQTNLLSAIGVLMLVLVSIGTYRWDTSTTMAYGMHVVSLDQVMDHPEVSFSNLEEQYGVQVALVATSMMDSIVDVRLKIIDPDKAQELIKNQAALLVDQHTLVLAPHMHSHTGTRLKAGKVFIIFFPTQQVIRSGSLVSLVFGNYRTEPVLVR